MASTTEGKLYLTALKSLEKLEIQFVPKELDEGRTSNMADIVIVGRNNPLYQYTGGTTDLSFELDFHAMEENREDVIRKVSLLKSWAYNSSNKITAERIRITFGRLFKENHVWVIKNIGVKYSQFAKNYGCLPQQAYVNLKLSLDPDNNLTSKDIKWS